MIRNILKSSRDLALRHKILLCYLAVFLLATLPFVRQFGKIINPDGVEYIAVAHHYAIFHFRSAINGIVSPLLSWLLVVPIALSLEPFYFFRFILIALSIITIIAFNALLRRELSSAGARSYVYHAAMLFIVSFCFYATLLTPLTPDLFSVFFIICLILAIRHHNTAPGWLNAVFIGLVGGLGYYGKNYFAYFAIATYALYFAMQFLKYRRPVRQVAQHFFITLGVTFALMGPWIGLMSFKYGQFTTNPIGSYVMGQVGPNYPGPFYRVDGLLRPPYNDSFDSREDPTFYHYGTWGPTASARDIRYYLTTVIPDNMYIGYQALLPELIVIVVGFGVAFFITKSKGVWATYYRELALVAAGLVYVGGYCLIDLAGGFRYIWPAYLLFGLAFFLLIDKMRLKIRPILLAAGTLTLALYPILAYFPRAVTWAEAGQNQRALAVRVKTYTNVHPHDRIASNNPLEAAYACYHLKLQCYGSPVPGNEDSQYKKARIDYVFNYNYTKPSLPAKHGTTIYRDKIVTIIKLRD